MNELEDKANKAGEDAAILLMKALNSMSYEKEVIKGFVEAVTCNHRTLQQSTMRGIFALIMEWAKKAEANDFDDRNKATVQFCKKIKTLATEENAYFPFI